MVRFGILAGSKVGFGGALASTVVTASHAQHRLNEMSKGIDQHSVHVRVRDAFLRSRVSGALSQPGIRGRRRPRRISSKRAYTMPRRYRRRRRVRRRRRRSRIYRNPRSRNVIRALPNSYRMRHHLDYHRLIGSALALSEASKSYQTDKNLILSFSADNLFNPVHYPGSTSTPTRIDAFSPPWYDEMVGLYERAKINSVFLVVDIADIHHVSVRTDGTAGVSPHTSQSPTVVGIYAQKDDDATIDSQFTLRPDCKVGYVRAGGGITRMSYRVNPARFFGGSSSWNNSGHVIEDPTNASASNGLMINCHISPETNTVGIHSNRFWVRARIWYDVTWQGLLKHTHDTTPIPPP